MKSAIDYAMECIGIKEWANGSNPEIEKMFSEAGHPGQLDDLAWCAAFVGAMLRRAGQTGTGSLAARSYLQWGKAVDLADAKPGDIVVFKRGNSSWQGHVAFYVSHDANTIAVLGGNQRDAVTVAKYGRASLLGVRRATQPARPVPAAPHVSKPPKIEHDAPVMSAKSPWAALLAFIASLFRKGA